MSYNIEYFRNKFKRFVIEVHHRKNRVGNHEHIIQSRDPNKPLLTLRALNNYDDSDGEVADQFIDFDHSGECDSQDNEPDATTQTLSNNISRVSSFERRVLDTLRNRSPTVGVTKPDDKNLIDLKEDQKKLDSSFVDNINYIEEKNPLPRRRFWFFGRRYPELESGNTEKQPIQLIDSTGLEEVPTINNIELIAHSSTEDYDKIKYQATADDSDLSPLQLLQAQDLFNFQTNDKMSSYSRKKHNVSLISLSKPSSKDGCKCGACIRKQLSQEPEPWKVIMNDISLHAALLSTGTKPQVQYEPYNNLVADFTNSKHQINQRRMFSGETRSSEVPSVQNLSKLKIGEIAIMNDENKVLDSDLWEFSKPPTRAKTSEANSLNKPNSRQSNSSIISELLNTGEPTSALYDDVFQSYEYSDESGKSKPEGHPRLQNQTRIETSEINTENLTQRSNQRLSLKSLRLLF